MKLSRIRTYNDYFPPYKAAVNAGAESVMSLFNEVDIIISVGAGNLEHGLSTGREEKPVMNVSCF